MLGKIAAVAAIRTALAFFLGREVAELQHEAAAAGEKVELVQEAKEIKEGKEGKEGKVKTSTRHGGASRAREE